MKMINYIKVFSVIILSSMIFISCEKEISTSQPENPPGKAQINISSNPTGTKIYLNNKNTGNFTPDSITFLDEGRYSITLKKNLFKDTTFAIDLLKDEKKTILVDYTSNSKMYGNIYCVSSPDKAKIFLNNNDTGLRTPNTIKKLWPGEYQIKYKHQSAYEDSLYVTVQSSQMVTAQKSLADTSVWVSYNTKNLHFPTDYLTCIDKDKSGKLWIGTLDKGVITFKNNSYQVYNMSNSAIPTNFITDIEVSDNGDIWIGTSDGLVSYINGIWSVYNSSNSVILDNYITTVESFGNNVWVGTSNGLIVFERDKNIWTRYDRNNSDIPHPWVTCIGMDTEGVIWFGTNGFGIVRFSRVWDDINKKYVESWLWFPPDENTQFPGKSIISIGMDPNGSRWFGHLRTQQEKGGITNLSASLRNIEWKVYFNDFVQDTYFEKIYFEFSTKWICTNVGLIYFENPHSIHTLRSDNSQMPHSNIKDLVFTNDRVIYLASFGGGLIKYKR